MKEALHVYSGIDYPLERYVMDGGVTCSPERWPNFVCETELRLGVIFFDIAIPAYLRDGH